MLSPGQMAFVFAVCGMGSRNRPTMSSTRSRLNGTVMRIWCSLPAAAGCAGPEARQAAAATPDQASAVRCRCEHLVHSFQLVSLQHNRSVFSSSSRMRCLSRAASWHGFRIRRICLGKGSNCVRDTSGFEGVYCTPGRGCWSLERISTSDANFRPIFTARTFPGTACQNSAPTCKLRIKKTAWGLQRCLEHTAEGTTTKEAEDFILLTLRLATVHIEPQTPLRTWDPC